jgi:Flp pilus assembly protein TadG
MRTNAQMNLFRTRFADMISRAIPRFGIDSRGVSAVEFALIAPVMIAIFFGVVAASQGVAADRKVTITARTLSDLVSQATSVTSNDVTNIFSAGAAIMTPFSASALSSTISSVNIDSSGVAKIGWSFTSNGTARKANDVVTVPAGLAAAGTQLIWSEVTYTFNPALVLPSGLTLSDQFYTRARQSSCVKYNSAC